MDDKLIQDTLYRENISWFVRKAFSTINPSTYYKHNWHIDCICEHLHALHEGEFQRLIINIEPRSLKSLIVSSAFPAWLLGRNPSEKIVCASYAQSLAEELSVETRHKPLHLEVPTCYRNLI